jgi:succinate dehydrogenase / fumarate reductase iron-sulfur subunit
MSTFVDTERSPTRRSGTFPVIRDLVTDVSFNYQKARELPAFAPPVGVAPGEYRMQQIDVERSQEFRKCIECFLCQNVCHVIRDHEENKPAFAGPRFFIRAAELDMHPLDARDDRKEMAQKEQGVGYCNITKCCTEVCPEHIKITDNAIIPMKERVVDRRFDPDRAARPQDLPPRPARRPGLVGGCGHTGARTGDVGRQRAGGEEAAAAGVQASETAQWHHQTPLPQGPPVGPDGRLSVSEIAMDRSGAASPYGDDITFPLPAEDLSYRHPE